MLYGLVNFSDQIGPLNVFRYVSFRTGGATMTALLIRVCFRTRHIQPAARPGGLHSHSETPHAARADARERDHRGAHLVELVEHLWVDRLGCLLLVASSGAFNVIDSRDVVSAPTVITTGVIGLLAFASGSPRLAENLHLPHIRGIAKARSFAAR
jgi:hypothetical protein